MSQTLLLGSNKFIDNNKTIVVNGVEVFRLWEQQGNDQLVADFEVRDVSNNLIAKVARNNFVYAMEGLEINAGPNFSEIIDAEGDIVARAEEVSLGVVRIEGTFYVDGNCIKTDGDLLYVNGMCMKDCESSCNGGGGIGIG
jgi:hypothetical protein